MDSSYVQCCQQQTKPVCLTEELDSSASRMRFAVKLTTPLLLSVLPLTLTVTGCRSTDTVYHRYTHIINRPLSDTHCHWHSLPPVHTHYQQTIDTHCHWHSLPPVHTNYQQTIDHWHSLSLTQSTTGTHTLSTDHWHSLSPTQSTTSTHTHYQQTIEWHSLSLTQSTTGTHTHYQQTIDTHCHWHSLPSVHTHIINRP